ncbi:CU044_5270 family protein [Streptosporangium sp. NBC_01495]|uniref:CU044_5270 family protein n=1 Tax=Streptosporangium sp. NBC_01495 TaxID=2903899 RepID=UPI002E36B8C3|nr:CU044_5270 family protein [Streptosporangium sp. NBC_01495]
MNDLDLVQDLRSEVRQSDLRTLHGARERLLTAMVPAPPPRRSRPMVPRLLGVGALGLSIVVGVTVLQGLDGTDSREGTVSTPVWAPAASVKSLAERASTAAAKVVDVYPRTDQWLYTKGIGYQARQKGTSKAGKRWTHELWQKGDGKGRARRYSDETTGKNAPLATGTPSGSSDAPRWDVAYLRSLPLDPAALLKRLRKDGENPSDRPDLPEAWMLFRDVQLILQEGAPPPRLRAALYTVVSELEGIGIEEKVKDLAGREGVGIYLDRGDGTRHEVIVDPKSYAYLGGREIFVGGGTQAPHSTHSTNGQYAEDDVIIAWAQVARGIVDHAGDLP